MAHPVPVCLADLQALAKEKLPRNVWDYYESGSDDMITLKRNETAFSR
jgi:(S)-2-hydroxy-acid oxidase